MELVSGQNRPKHANRSKKQNGKELPNFHIVPQKRKTKTIDNAKISKVLLPAFNSSRLRPANS
jgi:hypothetical protein